MFYGPKLKKLLIFDLKMHTTSSPFPWKKPSLSWYLEMETCFFFFRKPTTFIAFIDELSVKNLDNTWSGIKKYRSALNKLLGSVGFNRILGVEPKIGGKPPKWMVKIKENPMNKWMIWGYHCFWKHPYRYIYICVYIYVQIQYLNLCLSFPALILEMHLMDSTA